LRNLALACLYTYAALSLLGRTGRPTNGKRG
jgi:hypothetical protein